MQKKTLNKSMLSGSIARYREVFTMVSDVPASTKHNKNSTVLQLNFLAIY